MVTKRKHNPWSRVVSLLLVLLLCISGINIVSPLNVHATSATGTQGTQSDGNTANGNGSGTPTPGRTTSMVCLCFTFWEKNASNQWELKHGILQVANPKSSWFNASKYANEQHFEQHVSGSDYMQQYLSIICNTNVSVPNVSWDIYGQNHFASTYNSESYFSKICSVDERRGSVSRYCDMSVGRAGATKEECFAKTESFFNPAVNPSADQVIGNLQLAYQLATGSKAQLNNGSLEIGISEVIISVNCSGTTATINGAGYSAGLNSMAVQESEAILFKVGQQACFTYTGGTTVGNYICTYDIVHNPSQPDHSERPTDYSNPDVRATKSGEFVINKVYVDSSGGYGGRTFTTSSVCRSVYVDDEVGKIDDDWDFQFWCLSTIGASHLTHNDPSGFYTRRSYTNTGLVDMTEAAAKENNSNLKQINLLFIKTSNGQPGSTIMTEQTLGIGTTQTWDYVALDGREEVGYWNEDTSDCGYEWDDLPWIPGSDYTFGWEDNDGDGEDDDGWWETRQHDPTLTHYVCGADQTHLLSRKTTRIVSVGTANFSAVTFSNDIVGIDSSVSSTTDSHRVYVNRSGNTWTITRETEGHEPYHYKDGEGTVHVDHNPSASALTLFNDAKIQITGFALYRNAGLGDYIEQAFNCSAFVPNNYDDTVWTWYHPHISRVVSGEFEASVPSATYALGITTYTDRNRGTRNNVTALPSAEAYGSRGFIYTIPKGASTSHDWGGETDKRQNHPSSIGVATLRTSTGSGSTLLDEITVWSYLAHPNLTPAEFGDRRVYEVDVRPFVIMRLPYAMTSGGAPVQWDTTGNRQRAGYVMVKGEYDRTLHLGSRTTARAYPLDGIVVKPNTILNDARVTKYIVDDLNWVTDEVPYAIPGGSVIYVGQQAVGNQQKSTGAIAGVDIDTTQAFIGEYSPFRMQIDNNYEQLFDVNSSTLNTTQRLQEYKKEGTNWVRRYYGQPCADDAWYKGGKCLDEYYAEIEASLEKVYLGLYVYDTVDKDSFQLKDGKLLKRVNIDTPTGIIASGSTVLTLDGTARDLHLDEKYSFGGLDNHLYVRVIRDYYPTTQFSYVGIDTCGGAYTISGPPTSWDFREMLDTDFGGAYEYLQPLYVLVGEPATVSEFRQLLWQLDVETNPDAAKALYTASCQISIGGFANAVVSGCLSEAYALQARVDEKCNAKNVTYTMYLKDGQRSSSAFYNSGDPSLYDVCYQLANSVEHDVGNDFTWYADGDWYNEAVLPYYNVYTRQTFKLVVPANSSTIIDPSLMGISAGKDDMFGASDIRWNGAVVGLAFDGMTSSDFDNNMKLTLPSWGSTETYVELAPIGVSHPMAISNTSVNDLY